MKKNLVISTVAAIAAINPEGFTVNAANLQPVSTGYAVALKRTQNSFGAAFQANFAALSTEQRKFVQEHTPEITNKDQAKMVNTAVAMMAAL